MSSSVSETNIKFFNADIFTPDEIKEINKIIKSNIKIELEANYKHYLPIIYKKIYMIMETWRICIAQRMEDGYYTYVSFCSEKFKKIKSLGDLRYAPARNIESTDTNKGWCDKRLAEIIASVFIRSCHISTCETQYFTNLGFSEDALLVDIAHRTCATKFTFQWEPTSPLYKYVTGHNPSKEKYKVYDIPSSSDDEGSTMIFYDSMAASSTLENQS